MFSSSVQPALVSLLSTTSSECLDLFRKSVDESLPADSFICLLNDVTSKPEPQAPATLISPPIFVAADDGEGTEGHTLCQTVLHIQSPTLRTTFIRCPASDVHLGLNHPWLHLQVRNLGREWSFEVGVVDRARKIGIVRCSTFQRDPTLKMTTPPLLHLPLSFPVASTRPLTAWSTININLPSLLPHFSSASLISQDDTEPDDEVLAESRSQKSITVPVPSGGYSHISYVKVYATCRLRRIWLSQTGPGQMLPLEFDLYGQ
ncbi:hypothetical protein BC835DRAFT_1270956 [Cytidiella melzeri]|nr:hypothetical protein BC835DRAFT_1270956 [Cytidiella melzeri]